MLSLSTKVGISVISEDVEYFKVICPGLLVQPQVRIMFRRRWQQI